MLHRVCMTSNHSHFKFYFLSMVTDYEGTKEYISRNVSASLNMHVSHWQFATGIAMSEKLEISDSTNFKPYPFRKREWLVRLD